MTGRPRDTNVPERAKSRLAGPRRNGRGAWSQAVRADQTTFEEVVGWDTWAGMPADRSLPPPSKCGQTPAVPGDFLP